MIDIHQNMPISLILTPFDHFQIRPTFAVTPNLILEPCHTTFSMEQNSCEQFMTNLEVNEAGNNEKSSAVNLAIRALTVSPLNHFTLRHLNTVGRLKPILNTILKLTHTSSGIIEPPLSTVQFVN